MKPIFIKVDTARTRNVSINVNQILYFFEANEGGTMITFSLDNGWLVLQSMQEIEDRIRNATSSF